MKIVPMTLDHYVELYGTPPPVSVRGYAAVKDGKAFVVMGLYGSHGGTVAFMNALPEMRERHALTLVKMARKLELFGRHAMAVCDETVEAAPRFLAHFGFTPVGGGVWRR